MKDLRNKEYGRWTVLEFAGKKNKKHNTWKCRCDCGTEKVVYETNLISSYSDSCGCKRVEVGKENAKYIIPFARKHPSPRIATAAQVWRQAYRDGCPFVLFLELSQQQCHYCGVEPANVAKLHKSKSYTGEWAKDATFKYNGLDRVDNSKNHSPDNIVTCCINCNYAKRKRTYSEFMEWIRNVYERHQRTGIANAGSTG